MPQNETFKGFFSYAHHDAAASPRLVDTLKVTLELAVNANLVNATFTMRQDSKLRTGDFWDPAIESELRTSDLLVVLLSPCWISSDYCCKEYRIFEDVEVGDRTHTSGHGRRRDQ